MGLRADPVVISILVFQTGLATSIIWNSPEDLVISVRLPNLPQNSILILRTQFYLTTTIKQKPDLNSENTKYNSQFRPTQLSTNTKQFMLSQC